MRRILVFVILAAVGVAAVAAAASSRRDTGAASGELQVVAAEGFWGNIAAQLGGSRMRVTSVITSPAIDPHDYEPTSADARAIAGARMVIVNGIGYDPWASRLIDASPASGRVVLNVGDVVGIKPGGNPHRWYSPQDVQAVVRQIVRDYCRLEPRDAAYFRRQAAAFETRGLGTYRRLVASIRARFPGVPVGASESIFAPLAQALGLRLLTPASFLRAISEGVEPTAADTTAIQRQIARRQIKVWVFNSQNSTPDVARITEAARRVGIPVVSITETPSPPSASFQDWQVRQLRTLRAALVRATGR